MKRLLKWLVVMIAVLTGVIVFGSALLPGEALVQRQVVIAAPPETVFKIVGDIRRFNEWSPWAELDPDMSYTFEGPSAGTGQKMSWSSARPDVGKGSQTIVEFVQNRRVATALDFGEMGQAKASVELSVLGEGTAVTWGFKAELASILERWFGLLYDRWVGADFEKGLAKLKAVAEKEAAGG